MGGDCVPAHLVLTCCDRPLLSAAKRHVAAEAVQARVLYYDRACMHTPPCESPPGSSLSYYNPYGLCKTFSPQPVSAVGVVCGGAWWCVVLSVHLCVRAHVCVRGCACVCARGRACSFSFLTAGWSSGYSCADYTTHRLASSFSPSTAGCVAEPCIRAREH